MSRSTKICRTCKKDKPSGDFRDGRRRCIRCESKAYSSTWERNKEITCNVCGETKSRSEFYKGHKRCKSCFSNKPVEPAKKKDYMLRYTYGEEFGLPEYQLMLEEQNFKCRLCDNLHHEYSGKSSLHVDHCHTTGKVRGLLCTNCNTTLGLVGENIETLTNMIEYLNN
jgi:hypothetical protein